MMALRILGNRTLAHGLPKRACFISNSNSMSSSSVDKPKKQNKSVYPRMPDGKKAITESMFDIFKTLFSRKLAAADPNEPPINYKDLRLPNTTDWATGEEKLMLLAFENGILDPYCNMPIERDGRGSKDNPIKIPSFFDNRLVACSCEEAQTFVKYTYIHVNEPKRCACGFWMELVEPPRFWEKIPKEDLLEVSMFRDMEEEGYLDDFLARKCDKDGHPVHESGAAAHGKGHH